ncbi:MAG TPA: hydroxyisourate hydrolase [Gemmatimonadaceae bacterium]|nr:hydroxyisourate hydrolase [Gemmatimonadaceae bacterium]
MSTLSTHVLDTSLGGPASGIRVTLERVGQPDRASNRESEGTIGSGVTDSDGRLRDFVASGVSISPGAYRLRFDVAEYFARTKRESFYPEVVVLFSVGTGEQHYHVPLLLNPYGYSTYRGS